MLLLIWFLFGFSGNCAPGSLDIPRRNPLAFRRRRSPSGCQSALLGHRVLMSQTSPNSEGNLGQFPRKMHVLGTPFCSTKRSPQELEQKSTFWKSLGRSSNARTLMLQCLLVFDKPVFHQVCQRGANFQRPGYLHEQGPKAFQIIPGEQFLLGLKALG
jgi:hypothetical protein